MFISVWVTLIKVALLLLNTKYWFKNNFVLKPPFSSEDAMLASNVVKETLMIQDIFDLSCGVHLVNSVQHYTKHN